MDQTSVSHLKRLFNGRLGRRHNFMFNIVGWLITTASKILSSFIFPPLYFVVAAIILFLSIGVIVRRLHDLDLSGWWYLLDPLLLFFIIGTASYTRNTVFGIGPNFDSPIFTFAFILFVIFKVYLVVKRGDLASNRFGKVLPSEENFIKAILSNV